MSRIKKKNIHHKKSSSFPIKKNIPFKCYVKFFCRNTYYYVSFFWFLFLFIILFLLFFLYFFFGFCFFLLFGFCSFFCIFLFFFIVFFLSNEPPRSEAKRGEEQFFAATTIALVSSNTPSLRGGRSISKANRESKYSERNFNAA